MEFEELVDKERAYQDKLWGQQNYQPEKWLVILMEEIGEMAQEMLGCSQEAMEIELIQCAAVLKAMWESGKRNNWI